MIDINQLSPAARIHILREKYRDPRRGSKHPLWESFDDIDLLELVGQIADDMAQSSPNSAGWHFQDIMKQVGIRIARPSSFKCSCGRTIKINTTVPPD